MRRQGIRTRLARLERQRERRPFPRRVFGIYDKEDADVIGVEAEGVTVLRQPGEPLADLHGRAFALSGALCLFSLYARQSATERDNGPSGYRTPAAVPENASRAVAGVGRVASREELVRMGAIPISPERLV